MAFDSEIFGLSLIKQIKTEIRSRGNVSELFADDVDDDVVEIMVSSDQIT